MEWESARKGGFYLLERDGDKKREEERERREIEKEEGSPFLQERWANFIPKFYIGFTFFYLDSENY